MFYYLFTNFVEKYIKFLNCAECCMYGNTIYCILYFVYCYDVKILGHFNSLSRKEMEVTYVELLW